MKRIMIDGNGISRELMLLPLPSSFETTWAGLLPLPTNSSADWINSLPHRRCFCFGSEDGKLLFTDEDGIVIFGPLPASPSRSAINGVAISGHWLAASTGDEIAFVPLRIGVGESDVSLCLPLGSHGLIAMPSGHFVAAMGRIGIMAVAPPFRSDVKMTIYRNINGDPYCYQVNCLCGAGGTETLLVAARRDGFAFARFDPIQAKQTTTIAPMPGLEVVDSCPLFPGTNSLAIVILGRDGRLVFSRDLLGQRKVTEIQFEKITGTCYRVLSCRGDIYIMTSDGMFTLAGLANQFIESTPGSVIKPNITLRDIGIVDATLCEDRWLLVVTGDSVIRFDMSIMNAMTKDEGDDHMPDILRFDQQLNTKEMDMSRSDLGLTG